MKKIAFLICLVLLFCPSCSTVRQNESTTINQENLDSDAEIEPSWVKGSQEESEKVIEINGQTWQIKNDDHEIYSCKNDEEKIIHQIKDISTMSFFVTKIKDLSEDVVVVADPQGNGFRNLCMYQYNVEDEEWKRLSIIEAGIVLDDDTFYGFARVNEKGNLEFAERIPKRTPTVDEWEFIIYDVTYDAEEEAVKIEENKRLPGGIPLWWNNS